MICPTCKGKKYTTGFACPGFKPFSMACTTCGTSGDISEAAAKRIETGKAIREMRVKVGISLREQAAKLGLKPSVLSDMEFGRIEPDKRLLDAVEKGPRE